MHWQTTTICQGESDIFFWCSKQFTAIQQYSYRRAPSSTLKDRNITLITMESVGIRGVTAELGLAYRTLH